MSNKQFSLIGIGIVGLLIALIGAIAFGISYTALLSVFTVNSKDVPSWLAYFWPLMIDAPIIVFTVLLTYSELYKRSSNVWMSLIGLYTALTIAFNLYHAPDTYIGWGVAVIAPASLLITTEALRLMLKNILPAILDTTQQATKETEQQAIVQPTIAETVQPSVGEATQQATADIEQPKPMLLKRKERGSKETVQRTNNEPTDEQKIAQAEAQEFFTQVIKKELTNLVNYNPVDGLTDKQRKAMEYLLGNPYVSINRASKDTGYNRATFDKAIELAGLYKNGNGWKVKE